MMATAQKGTQSQVTGRSKGGSIHRTAERGSDDVATPRLRMVAEGTRASGSDWIGLRRTDVSSLQGVRIFPMAIGLAAAAALIAAIALAWFLEGWRRKG